MVDSWNPAVLNETTQDIDSWNPAELNQVTTKVDSWNPAILNKNLESAVPVVFSATITASFPEGATCTATDGTTTLTADDNPMAFSIPNSGTWAVACVANGVTFSEEVVITTNGQTETVNLTPDGATVTPTDSVPILIACAGIGDSTYTTIAEIIADSELLTEITTNDNTIAYLVRSTTFANSIAADEDAMTAIGASNECSDALLENSTWLNVICNSTYFESVLNAKVPTMTSNTAPSGTCFSSGIRGAGYEAYKAFDNNGSTNWQSDSTAPDGEFVGYQFVNDATVVKADINLTSLQNGGYPITNTVVIEGSDDGVTYTPVSTSNVMTFTAANKPVSASVIFTGGKRKYFRLSRIGASANMRFVVNSLQLTGRQDVNV